MPKNTQLDVSSLCLDLKNYRTIQQKNEAIAINTMIAIHPEWFWALIDSLLDDGYHPTENIIVLNIDGKHIVKEGNRRVAALKLIFGIVKGIELPDVTKKKIEATTDIWKKENEKVPCSVFNESETQSVDKIISLIHAKGERAGRDQWTAVARARYNRDQKNESEPSLDILEKYLKNGKNFSEDQAERWSGDYPISVLVEALQKIFPHLGLKSVTELVKAYPNKNKSALDKLMFDIGMQKMSFKELRDKQAFFAAKYGITQIVPAAVATVSSQQSYQILPQIKAPASYFPPGPTSTSLPSKEIIKQKAYALNDSHSVSRKLKLFSPRGNGRDKVVTLLKEIKTLKIEKHPHAFCFLLRSMFEISAKAYCADHNASGGLTPTNKNGFDKRLAELLKEITNHLTSQNKDNEKMKVLHGSLTELNKPDGLLSVTSMNHLVHNPSFSILPSDICILFGNVFPLLDEMNK